MSVQWLSWVFDHSSTKGARRLVLLSLANHANEEGLCWPSLDRVAREAGLSRRRVEDAVRALVADGLIEREVNGAPMARHAGYRPNLYRLIRASPEAQDETGPPEPVAPDDSGPPQTSGPDGSATPDTSTVGVDKTGEQATTERPPESLEEPSVEPSCASADAPPLLRLVDNPPPDAAERFENHIWPIWPRRHGKRVGKAKALAYWRKLSDGDQRAAWRGAKNYAQHCETTGEYPKDAERWLRDRLWTEWQQPAQPQPTGPPRYDPVADLPNRGALTMTREQAEAAGLGAYYPT